MTGRKQIKYVVSGVVEVIYHTTITASTPEKAIERAIRLDKEGDINWEEGNWDSGVEKHEVACMHGTSDNKVCDKCTGEKTEAQKRLTNAQNDLQECCVKLKTARDQKNQDAIRLYEDLKYSLMNDLKYWEDVVAGRR